MHVFADADWTGGVLTKRSTTGYVLLAAGGPIAWQSKLQTTVSTSSMQARYQAIYAIFQLYKIIMTKEKHKDTPSDTTAVCLYLLW